MLAVITGANRGMGLEITRSVLAAGYDVVMACRNVELAEKQRESLLADYPASKIDVLKVDLASLESVTGFTEELLKRGERIDLLMNNAGSLLDRYRQTRDGLEFNVSVNYVAPFLLTTGLLPLMGEGSRIVNMASLVYRFGRIDLPEFFSRGSRRKYNRFRVYANSKLAITLFTLELSRRVKGKGITVNACDPGIVSTDIIRMNNKVIDSLCDALFRPLINTPKKGASTAVDLLLNPVRAKLTGSFCKNCHPVHLNRRITEHPMRTALWAETEALLSK